MMIIQIEPTFKNTVVRRSCKNIDVHRSCPKRPPKKRRLAVISNDSGFQRALTANLACSYLIGRTSDWSEREREIENQNPTTNSNRYGSGYTNRGSENQLVRSDRGARKNLNRRRHPDLTCRDRRKLHTDCVKIF
ncbi:hypothetical protein TNIN_125921 [Trichonephila inaurata madagascariensis]|uniref:Uncharacterized protein n=1 Tax=Trichonephila inaurata madagascariensis TaxID=2747483 RepID=A0A8X6Y4U5_9ARAC|nr:hypothetical protein TNIN_125921 [Trichonephila inaurata madagascariensis]